MHQYKERRNIHTKGRWGITVTTVSIVILQMPAVIQRYNKPISRQVSIKKIIQGIKLQVKIKTKKKGTGA